MGAPETPDWLNKSIAQFTRWRPFEAQINGDYVGRRYATYLNDIAVAGNYLVGLEASYLSAIPPGLNVRTAKISGNVDQPGNTKASPQWS